MLEGSTCLPLVWHAILLSNSCWTVMRDSRLEPLNFETPASQQERASIFSNHLKIAKMEIALTSVTKRGCLAGLEHASNGGITNFLDIKAFGSSINLSMELTKSSCGESVLLQQRCSKLHFKHILLFPQKHNKVQPQICRSALQHSLFQSAGLALQLVWSTLKTPTPGT
jgi:hypothetical protein